jgi:hypothetical protein
MQGGKIGKNRGSPRLACVGFNACIQVKGTRLPFFLFVGAARPRFSMRIFEMTGFLCLRALPSHQPSGICVFALFYQLSSLLLVVFFLFAAHGESLPLIGMKRGR